MIAARAAPFHTQWWFLIIVALIGIIMILLVVTLLCYMSRRLVGVCVVMCVCVCVDLLVDVFMDVFVNVCVCVPVFVCAILIRVYRVTTHTFYNQFILEKKIIGPLKRLKTSWGF